MMKRTVAFSVLLFVLFITIQAQDKVYTVDNIPKVHLQDKTRYVCDPSDILTSEATGIMDDLLYNLEQETGIETVVAVVPSIGDADCFDFSHQLLNQWGVGKKEQNNGLVILLVTDQRCIQFYTGYGLEGVLPDAICKRIQTQEMIPYLKDGDWNNGMVAGIQAVCGKLDGSMEYDGDNANNTGESIMIIVIMSIMTLIVVLAPIFALYMTWKKSKCPRCHKHGLRKTNEKVIAKKNGVITKEVTRTCRICGYSQTRRQQFTERSYYSSGSSSSGGGGSSRGGGGSFGGGRGGGGGAGSRF